MKSQYFTVSGMKKSGIKYFGIAFLIMVTIVFTDDVAFAQNQEVTIIAPYQPTISNAFKMPLNPVLKDTVIPIPKINYSIRSEPVYTSYDIAALKPSLIAVDPKEVMRRNYLKAGFGNYTMPFVELFTNSLSSKDFAIGFHARHLSAKGSVDDYGTSSFSQNNVDLFVKRYLKDKIFSGKVYYDRNLVHYYGYKPDAFLNDTLSDEEIRQRFSTIGADIDLLSSNKRNNKLNYYAGFHFYHLSDLCETNEMKIGLNTNFNSTNEFFNFVDKQELGADVNFDFYNNADSLQSEGTITAELKPYLRWNFEYLELTIGARGVIASDSVTNFYIYPEVRASYQVIPDYLRFYAAVSGGLNRNSYRKVASENPWVNPIFPLGFTSTKYDIKGGVTGKINMTLDYNFSVSYADVQNMLFFNNDYFSAFNPAITQNFGNKFTGIYDDAQVTTVSMEIGYQQSRLLNILFKANYRDYQLQAQAKPWHKPVVEAMVSGKYLFSDKISINGELVFNSKTYAQILESGFLKIEENSGYIDLNLGAEYRFNDRVSAFAQVNNITSSRYFRWYNYPSQRINAMAGFTFSF